MGAYHTYEISYRFTFDCAANTPHVHFASVQFWFRFHLKNFVIKFIFHVSPVAPAAPPPAVHTQNIPI